MAAWGLLTEFSPSAPWCPTSTPCYSECPPSAFDDVPQLPRVVSQPCIARLDKLSQAYKRHGAGFAAVACVRLIYKWLQFFNLFMWVCFFSLFWLNFVRVIAVVVMNVALHVLAFLVVIFIHR